MKTHTILASIILSFCFINIFCLRAYAHQSGCHRWHSCPSDSGSYACGDLGYYTYCETSTVETYSDQGIENGNNQAQTDGPEIEDAGKRDGFNSGYNDGYYGHYLDTQPDAYSTCDKSFDFDGFAPIDYQDAFYEEYRQVCSEYYERGYKVGYEDGFNEGTEDYEASRVVVGENEPAQDNDTGSSNGIIAWLLTGVVAVVALIKFKN